MFDPICPTLLWREVRVLVVLCLQVVRVVRVLQTHLSTFTFSITVLSSIGKKPTPVRVSHFKSLTFVLLPFPWLDVMPPLDGAMLGPTSVWPTVRTDEVLLISRFSIIRVDLSCGV